MRGPSANIDYPVCTLESRAPELHLFRDKPAVTFAVDVWAIGYALSALSCSSRFLWTAQTSNADADDDRHKEKQRAVLTNVAQFLTDSSARSRPIGDDVLLAFACNALRHAAADRPTAAEFAKSLEQAAWQRTAECETVGWLRPLGAEVPSSAGAPGGLRFGGVGD